MNDHVPVAVSSNMVTLLLMWIAGVGQFGVSAQQTPASIDGIVIKMGSGEPIANARIQLDLQDKGIAPPGALSDMRRTGNSTARSDSSGRFTFENVTPGTYRLIATYDGGFVPAEYSQRSPTQEGTSLVIAPGQKITGVQLSMAPTGAISGHIYGKNGEPLGNAQVMALRQVYKDGHRGFTISQMVATDDRGEYRLFWLAPGRYFVAAKPDITEVAANIGLPNTYNAQAVRITPPMRLGTFEEATIPSVKTRKLKTGEIVEEMYQPVYYPGTVDAQSAAPIEVPAGATVGGVEITTEAGLIRAYHIRGRIIDQRNGQPVANASLSAVPSTDTPFYAIPAARSNIQGSFDIAGAASGAYQIFVTRYGESLAGLNGIAQIEISDRDINNLPIAIGPEFDLPGRFVMEDGSRSYPRIANLSRYPQRVGTMRGGFSYNPPPNEDGSFTLQGVTPGDFRVTLSNLPAGGYIKSMRLGNADVLNDGLHLTGPPQSQLEIVIGSNAGTITGTVTDSLQKALPGRTVVLVPDVRLRQRSDLFKVATADAAGRFEIKGITPGEYKLFAWDTVEPGAWQDPAFIAGYETAGRPTHIYEGTGENIQLQVIP